jgi:hypothetical protein
LWGIGVVIDYEVVDTGCALVTSAGRSVWPWALGDVLLAAALHRACGGFGQGTICGFAAGHGRFLPRRL